MAVGISGKVVVVSGGSTGLGFAISQTFAATGARVLVVSRRRERVDAAVKAIQEGGGTAAGLAIDVTTPGAAAEVVAAARRTFGRVDVLVNCAGVYIFKPFLELTEEDWQISLATHMSAPFRLTQAVARAFIEQGEGGVVINIASVHGAIGEAAVVAQSASKSGLIGLTKATAEALRDHDIRVNAIAPGAIEADSAARAGTSPRRRVTQADVASFAVYLASDNARTITGTTVELYGVTRPALALT